MRIRAATVLLALGAVLPGCGSSAGYPDRPIVLISPWAAGGGTDRVARHVGLLLEQSLGVPVNVVNATGGAGVTGFSRGALARADGYTLTLATVELNMLHFRGLTSIGPQDFEPLALVNRDPAALFVRADAPWPDLPALEADIRDAPGTLRASGTARGGIWHVALAGWLDAAGLPADSVVWIPINGASPSLQQLLSGGVEIVSASVPEARNLLDAGSIRCLAIMGDQRVPELPDVPTLAELGEPFALGVWRGVAAPRGIPDAVRTRLLTALEAILESDAYLDFMGTQGFGADAVLGEDFRAFLEADDAAMGRLLASPALANLGDEAVGPYAFPVAVAVILVVATVGLLVTGQLRARESVGTVPVHRLVEVVAGVVVFTLAAEWLGYVLTAAVLLLALLVRLGTRPRTALIVTLVTVPFTYQLFAVWLRVPLPVGLFGW